MARESAQSGASRQPQSYLEDDEENMLNLQNENASLIDIVDNELARARRAKAPERDLPEVSEHSTEFQNDPEDPEEPSGDPFRTRFTNLTNGTGQVGDQTAVMTLLADLCERQIAQEKDRLRKERILLKEKEAMEERLRRREMEHLAAVQKLLRNNNTATVEKRVFVTLPVLTNENELENWDSQLRAALAPYGLFKYLEKDIPKPEPTGEDDDDFVNELSKWNTDRADIFKLMTASLKKGTIWSRMTRIGWKPEHVDPRQTYLKVFEALQHGTVHTTRLLIKEYFELRPAKFDSMDAYINRVCTVRQRLRNIGIAHPLETDVYTVLSAVKESYPELFDRNIKKMEDKTLTWEILVKDMTETCVDRDSAKKAMVNVSVNSTGKKKKDDTTNTTSSSTDIANDGKKTEEQRRADRIKQFGDKKCSQCDKYFKFEVRHCNGCNRHYNPANCCWFCSPEKAPETWKYKAEYMEKKKANANATTTTSTALVHQNSGLANPANSAARAMHLLHSTNFMTMQPHFREGPRTQN
jgi:hypothetical protein